MRDDAPLVARQCDEHSAPEQRNAPQGRDARRDRTEDLEERQDRRGRRGGEPEAPVILRENAGVPSPEPRSQPVNAARAALAANATHSVRRAGTAAVGLHQDRASSRASPANRPIGR